MKKQFPIYIDRLREGRVEHISQEISPELLDISDDEIDCVKPVLVKGEAYLAEDFLLVSVSLVAEVILHCSVCNEPFAFTIELPKIDQEVPLDEIHDAVFDLLPLLREVLLVEIPFYPQCGGQECKNRKDIEKYFSKGQKLNNPFESL